MGIRASIGVYPHMGELQDWLKVQNEEVVQRVNLTAGSARLTVTLSLPDAKYLVQLSERLLMPKTRLASKLLVLAIHDAMDNLRIGPLYNSPPEDLTPEDIEEAQRLSREDLERRLKGLRVTVDAEEVADDVVADEVRS